MKRGYGVLAITGAGIEAVVVQGSVMAPTVATVGHPGEPG